MTHQEIRIRAREACAAEMPHLAQEFRAEQHEDSAAMQACLRALTDLDKPIPDPDEAWRPALIAYWSSFGNYSAGTPLSHEDRRAIAALIAALPLIPEQYR